MNTRVITTALLIAVLPTATMLSADNQTILLDEADRTSYSIGQQIGADLKKQKIPMNETILHRGITDGLSDSPPLVPAREMNARLIQLKKSIAAQMNEDAALKKGTSDASRP